MTADRPPADPAVVWARGARFLTTASRLDQLPPPDRPEIAFVGRSNAGKSTAINTLAQHRRLAFASKTPGRTQHINLFELGPEDAPDARWADLPGYGYAAVARGEKLRWQQVMADYLAWRHALAGIVMMVDSRHGFTSLDLQLLQFVRPRVATGEVRLLVLLTKADKLTRDERVRAQAAAERVLESWSDEQADVGVCLFSALDRQGVDDVVQALHGWREPARTDAGAVDDDEARAVDTDAASGATVGAGVAEHVGARATGATPAATTAAATATATATVDPPG